MRAAAQLDGRLRRRRVALALFAALLAALLVAGCGGGGSPGVANLGRSHAPAKTATGSSSPSGGQYVSTPPTGGSAQSHFGMKIVGASAAQELRYAECMRAHGVPSFPDPSSNGVFDGSDIDPNAPQFQSAQAKCSKDLPHSGPITPAQKQQALAHLLAYSRCMRSHGVTSFPDPTTKGGGVGIEISGNSVDPSSPVFQRAQAVCGHLQGAPPGFGGGGR